MNPLDRRWEILRARWPIRVKNSSGEAVPPFAVMRITSWTKTNNEIVYTIGKPNTTFYRRYLVNGPITIGAASGSEGIATFLDQGGPVYFGGGSPGMDEEWGATSGQWYLTQHRPGFLVGGSTTETFNGKSLLVAKQYLVQMVYGKADTAISLNSAGTVRVYGGEFGAESDTSQTIASCYNKSTALSDEAEVTVAWPHGRPLVAKLVC